VTSVLEAELLVHLDAQITSGQRLLGLVLEQGKAIRKRDVDAVLARLTDVQTEMGRRGALEQDRAALLQRAGAALGVPAAQVTLERSAELRGLLAEIAREHGINRALMRQELAFLAHLTRLVGQDTEPGYTRPGGTAQPPAAPPLHRALDLQA
jgi:hypothetical protein